MRLPRLRVEHVVPLALALLAVLNAAPARADAIRVVAADDRGITLALDLPAFRLTTAPDGRSFIEAGGLPLLDEPGRPRVPYASALIAVPPGASVTATVQGAEETRDRVALVLGTRPGFRNDVDRLGLVPTREDVPAITDGPWPPSPIDLGQPFTLRGQRLVELQIRPFRYDELTGRLWARRSVIVRLSFTGAPAAAAPGRLAPEDRHFEPVLKRAILNYQQGRAWRATPGHGGPVGGGSLLERMGRPVGAHGAAAFDESEIEVRVKIDTTGVWALEYSKLAAAGFPAGVPIGELSVHRHEFTGYTSPSYETIELPIEVEEGVNRNGVFDAGDRIDLWVQNWAERSRASLAQRAWGDAEVVYVTRKRTGGLRIPLRGGWLGGALPVLPSYPWTQHWERNFVYQPYPADTNSDQFSWTDILSYYDRPDTILFETNRLDNSQPVTFGLTVQGRAETSHYCWCRVENGAGQSSAVCDSALWPARQSQTFTQVLPGTALTEGRTNRVQVWGRTNGGAPDPTGTELTQAGINYFEATYWRSYRALDHLLSCNSGSASVPFEIDAAGFASDSIRVYDVGDSLNPVRLTDVVIPVVPGDHVVQFQDQVSGAMHKYVAFDRPRLLPQAQYTAVTRRQLYAQGAGDYLLIVPEVFLPAAQTLATLRQSEGLNVVIAPLESVNDEFNGGRKSSYAIRRFVRHGYDHWGASFVLLFGDGSEDPRRLLNTSTPDWVPIQKVFEPVGVPAVATYAYEIAPGDAWYVWTVDTAPDPGPANMPTPLLPDLNIGRLPVNSLQQATDLVSKLAAYETVDTTQTWRRRMLFHSDDDYSGATTFGGGGTTPGYCLHDYELVFRDLNLSTQQTAIDSSGLALSEPEQFDMNVYLANQPPVSPNCRNMTQVQNYTRANITPQLLLRLNDGRLWWNYQGHANAYVLEHESIYQKNGDFPGNNDVQRFTNVGKPFLFTAFSCHANAFASTQEGRIAVGPSIGEDMVTWAMGGAIASWASVGFEAVPTDHSRHLNQALAKSLFYEPPSDNYLGHGASVVLGEGLTLALIRNHYEFRSDPSFSGVGLTYTLLGDPATRVTIGAPQILVTANGQPVTDGLAVFLPGSSDTLLLRADLVSNAAIDSVGLELINEAGTTVIPPTAYTLSPPFPDTGPGGGGGRRFLLTYRATIAAGRYTYRILSRDRYGVLNKFDVLFDFTTVLLSSGVPIRDGDAVARDAALTLGVQSPNVLNPATDMELRIDGAIQAFTPNPATPGRQFVLSWTHPPYAPGTHTVQLAVNGAPPAKHTFNVVSSLRIADLISYPNPFDDDLGPRFTFDLLADQPADVMVRVFTVNGKMVWERVEHGLLPGHHELAWDGHDDEGEKLANGVYLYRLLAKGPSGSAAEQGRLVKLRKPKQATDTTGP